MTPRLSVIVPTFDRRESVRRLLRSLNEQAVNAERFEVIVSIDGSRDGTAEMVRELRPAFDLRAIWHERGGRAAACNAGVAEARGSIVLFLDDDMEAVPGCLEAHERAHTGRVGVLGAVPAAPGGPPVSRYLAMKFDRHLATLASAGRPLRLRDFYTGNFSIERAVLLDVGGFDEEFGEYGNEDLELLVRLRRIGVRILYAADAAAIQHFTKRFTAVAEDQVAKGRTAILLATKHPEVRAELKVAQRGDAPALVRAIRDVLLRATRAWPALRRHITRCIEWLERAAPSLAMRIYAPALGYFYWVGVEMAQAPTAKGGRAKPAGMGAGAP